MARLLQRVVVLGAGTMGARLAAHCVNHGLETTLLDLDDDRARAGLQAAVKSRPAAFFLPELLQSVRTGSFESADQSLRQADWVIEAVTEQLEAKRALLGRIAPLLAPDALLSTNTSGLPVNEVGSLLPQPVRQRWMGTHFFNPPRYMRLVEVIPGPETDPDAMQWLSAAIERRLGKGIVAARDTPNFIANRLGLFALLNNIRLMCELGLSIEEVDAATGPALGWPKSATFRTLDLIGIDTLAHVIRNSQENLRHDERRELFQVPAFLQAMIERQWLGEKSGQGFYRREGDAILALDWKTLTYHPRQKIRLPFDEPTAAARQSPLLQRGLPELFAYCRARMGEITDSADDIDRAMRWGYNWQYGPFELEALVGRGVRPERRLGREVRRNPGCSLLDVGDGVGCFEFHTKLNTLGGDTITMVSEALSERGSPFDAFVMYNGAEAFSAGANLAYLLATIQNEDWEEVEGAVRQFQAMTQLVKRSPRPVVVAPFGLSLGGGCELMLHGARVVAHAELYAGLVESGVGLIPAGGGTKEMTLRCEPRTAFETIALAKVSTSALEARQFHYLQPGDLVVANRERVLAAARQTARGMADAGYEAPGESTVAAPGPGVESTLRLAAFLMHEAGRISDHDRLIADKLAHIVGGGGAPAGAAIPEAKLLELEREAFLSLCGEVRTQERMAYMLKTGKPLRN